MSVSPVQDAVASSSRPGLGLLRLLPICAVVFLGFLAIGLPLPVLPLTIRQTLGFGPGVVGLVMGLQSIATLATRHFAGTLSDSRGPKRAVLYGLVLSALSGVVYLLSAQTSSALLSLAILAAGRVVLGLGESLLITGALSWGVGLVGAQSSGRVISWNGIAMYGALAAGAPIGIAIERVGGFPAVSIAVAGCPVVALLISAVLKPTQPVAGVQRIPFYKVISLIWRPGLGLALSAVGYGSLAAFGSLFFAAKGWVGASTALIAFGGSYILARLFFSGLPDKLGGSRVACVSLVIECVGQLILWTAGSPTAAFLGAGLTGFGFSLVFPSFGVEAVKRIPAQNRGAAMGAYVAFFDIALGVVGPLSGAAAGVFGYSSLFLLGALCSVVSFGFAATLHRRSE